MFLGLLGFFFVIYCLLAWLSYSKITKFYSFYNKTYPRLENLPNEWAAFIRQDKHQWDKKQILKGCILRFPWKCILFFQYILVCFAIIIITIPFGSKICNKILRVYGRFYGTYVYKLIWNIKEPSGINKKIIKTPIVISNHVCWIDTMYLIVTFYPISFLSKAEVKKIPIGGRITTNAQSIYIQRGDSTARQKIIKDIKERVEGFMAYAKKQIFQEVYPLIIFPEGTVSNGKSLLTFKLGAFNDLAPITIVALKYTCDNFDVGMTQITQLQHFLMSLTLKVNLTVDITQMQAKQNEKPEQYCERARQKLAQMTGFKKYNVGFRQRQQHNKMIKQKIQSEKNKKLS